MNESQPNYYAVIPANVRYDKELKPNEKLLYGEITALANKTGECWATNSYFAELYKVHANTISLWINTLKNRGYISTKIAFNEDRTNSIRIIKIIKDPINENIGGYQRKAEGGYQRKAEGGINEKLKHNNTSINITSINNISPLSPYKIFKEETNYQDETYLKINDWLMYKEEKQQSYKERGLKGLFTTLKTNIAEYGEEAVCNVIDESMSNNYQGIMWDKLARTHKQAKQRWQEPSTKVIQEILKEEYEQATSSRTFYNDESLLS